MKIRNGFVSNSSSSSFCIIGVYFDDAKDALDKLSIEVETKETDCECALDCDKLRPEGANFCPSCGSKLFKETTEYDMREQLRTACAALKIGVILDEWGICVFSIFRTNIRSYADAPFIKYNSYF